MMNRSGLILWSSGGNRCIGMQVPNSVRSLLSWIKADRINWSLTWKRFRGSSNAYYLKSISHLGADIQNSISQKVSLHTVRQKFEPNFISENAFSIDCTPAQVDSWGRQACWKMAPSACLKFLHISIAEEPELAAQHRQTVAVTRVYRRA